MSSKLSNMFRRKGKDLENPLPQPDDGALTGAISVGLHLLYDGMELGSSQASAEGTAVDIVAVHGLGGHPIRSFQHDNGCFWLRDLLPKDLPSSRIFSYGHDSQLLFSKSAALLREVSANLCAALDVYRDETSSRPLVFIAQSLGGFIVKEAVVLARNTSHFRNIYERTIGILFFGTPHRGTSTATMAVTLARLAGGLSKAKPDLLEYASTNSEQSLGLGRDFLRASSSMMIFSFYETLATSSIGKSQLIVERNSTVLDSPYEVSISLYANHRGLCKYDSREDTNYRIVLSSLERTCRSNYARATAEALVMQPSEAHATTWIPNVVSKRGKTSAGLFEMLGSMEEPDEYSGSIIDIIAVHGLRGSAIRSWQSRESGSMWLRDMLQKDYPNARVMSYGYKAEPVMSNNELWLEELASDFMETILDSRQDLLAQDRPLMLIGYSFGGLIIKQMLTLLHGRTRTRPASLLRLRTAMTHFVFLGVPHSLETATFANRWVGIVQSTAKLENLAISSLNGPLTAIFRVTEEFARLKDLEASNVAESRPTKLPQSDRLLLVPVESARLGWGARETVFVARNKSHLELPVFVDAEDPTYIYIRDAVGKLLRDSRLTNSGEELRTFKSTHEHLGPLFMGAYLNSRDTIEEALESGADIAAEDDLGRTSLHWAADRGNHAVVKLLVENGASIETQAYAGWTSLHLAAQNGHTQVVQLLLAQGANVDSLAFDYRTPLHLAVQSIRLDIVAVLLEAGANPTKRTSSGLNAFHLAQELRFETVLKALMDWPSAPKALLQQAIVESAPDMLKLLFRFKPDVIEERLPWVTEFLDHTTSSEIVDLILKSENLQWVDDEAWPNRPSPTRLWKDQPQPEHRKGCFHSQEVFSDLLLEDPGDSPLITNKKDNTDRNSTDISDLPIHERLSTSKKGSPDSLPDYVLDPMEYFNILELREQRLFDLCGIGGIYPPSKQGTTYINAGHGIFRGSTAYIMYGGLEKGSGHQLITMPVAALNSQTKAQNFGEDGWGDAANDDSASTYSSLLDSTFSLGPSDSSSQTGGSYNSIANENNFEIWDQETAQGTLEALNNVVDSLRFLHDQRDANCCERFTILLKSFARERVVSLESITLLSLASICAALEEFCHASDTKPPEWTKQLANACIEVFTSLGCGEFAREYLNHNLGRSKTINPGRCIHLSALIAQVASVAIVTYSRGHSRDYYHASLSRTVETFVLCGSELSGPVIYGERMELACMGDMLGRKVWVFHTDKNSLGQLGYKYLLSTGVSELLDTWGGSISIGAGTQSKRSNVLINLGGGSLIPVQNEKPDSTLMDDEVLCHWTSDSAPEERLIPLSHKKAQLLIGVTRANRYCRLQVEKCQDVLSASGDLIALGTSLPGYKKGSKTKGVSAGLYGNLNASYTRVYDDGCSSKKRLLEGWKETTSLKVLKSPWGLEVSLCTGIAQRIPLRNFFYGRALEYLRRSLGRDWKDIEDIAHTLPEKSDANFEDFIENLTDEQDQSLKVATSFLLQALETTGVQKDDESFVLWWPEPGVASPRGLKVKKKEFSGKDPWMPMVKDSTSCAVFGMLTDKCLEHPNLSECRHNTVPSEYKRWQDIKLDTYLTPASRERIGQPITYSLNDKLVIWQQQDLLSVEEVPSQYIVHLKFLPSTIAKAQAMIRASPYLLRKYQEFRKWEVVRERQELGDQGQNVVVL